LTKTERIVLRGLEAPAQIRIDRWGVAHIGADGKADLFFAQGFNAARDRLWQIDLWRKRGLGWGQSGDSRLPHYRDLAPLWAKGEYAPLLYSDDAVSAATEAVIQLFPEPKD
jgi:acyl-homoserine lactone acylase PvdQ